MAEKETVKTLSTKTSSSSAAESFAGRKYRERRHSSLTQPLPKHLPILKHLSSKTSSSSPSGERKNRERRHSSLTNSLTKQLSIDDKNNNRVAINLPVAKVGSGAKQKGKPLLSRKVTGRDRNVKYWAWLEEIDIDTLDGLTEEVKEKLRNAAATRKLTEEDEEDCKKNGLHRQMNVTQYLHRVCSEVFPSAHHVRSLEERTYSEPSVIAHEEDILNRIRIWHPSGFAKAVKPILKSENNRRFLNVCFQQKHKFISPIVSTEKKPRKTSQPTIKKSTTDSDSFSDKKQQKPIQAPLKRKYSDVTKPERLVSRISIVNMSFEGGGK